MLKVPGSVILSAISTALLAGCSVPEHAQDPVSSQSDRPQQIIALIDSSPITQSELSSTLHEQIGKQALLELILDRQLDRESFRLQLEITQEDLDREVSIFVRTISDKDHADRGYKLLNTIRTARGLGPNRFPRLLRRNAILRGLVGNAGTPSPTELKLAEQIAFGPTYRVRLFVSESRSEAVALRRSVLDLPIESRRWLFADTCTTNSIHPSSSRGGLIPNLSSADPRYPDVFVEAIESTTIGTLSRVLSTDSGFTLILVESRSKEVSPTPDQIKSVRDELSLRKQSLEMERLADRLIRESDVIVMDRALNWSWTNQK